MFFSKQSGKNINNDISSSETSSGQMQSFFENTPIKSNYPITPEKNRNVKLTLRMKRSPILDDKTESRMSYSDDCGNDCGQVPEYEVLRVEGVDEEDDDDEPQVMQHQQRKKHKTRDRERRRSKKHVNDINNVLSSPPKKRIRIIYGNETHCIIDLPHS